MSAGSFDTHSAQAVLAASGVVAVSADGWRLVPPFQVDQHRITGPLVFSLRTEFNVYGDDTTLVATLDEEIPFGTKNVWLGGHINTTLDPSVRDLWLANGFDIKGADDV